MRVLAVDDEKIALEGLLNSIRTVQPKAQLAGFRYAEDSISYAKEHSCDVAFLDIDMPDINGISCAEQLKRINPDVNIIFCTGYGHYRAEAFDLHASGYIEKPVTVEKIRRELDNLRRPVKEVISLRVQTFGNFEAYYENTPLNFKYSRTKEMLAYLVDRKGSLCTNDELMAILFEDDSAGHQNYIRSLRKDLKDTLESVGCGDALTQQRGRLGIVPERMICDYYDYLKQPDNGQGFSGEYMTQYSWSEVTLASLQNKKYFANNI